MTIDANRLRELLDYNKDTGTFTRKCNRGRWNGGRWKAGEIAGSVCRSGYLFVGIDYKRFPAHRLAWLYVFGEWPNGMIDHINGDRADNRITNLRIATPAINSQNQRRARSDNKSSGIAGVSWHAQTGKWRAKIHLSGKSIHLGLFANKEEAGLAYVVAKRRLHDGCTI